MKILGAWYSDCGHHPKVLKASLDSVKAAMDKANGYPDTTRCEKGNNVEVVTCTWKRIPGNPFPDLPARFQNYCLFGIIGQILQILYHGRDKLSGEYLGVSFLETDTIYPKDHFLDAIEALEANPDAPGVINKNYIGVRKDGYCRLNQLDEPTHQMTMRWDYAIQHFERAYLENLRLGQYLLEPDDKSKFVRLPISPSRQPALHINHNHHMTSHYNIFAATAYTRDHPLWGDYRQFYPLEWCDTTGALDSQDPLEKKYDELCRSPSALNEILPILRRLVGECGENAGEKAHVTEFGTYMGESATALLAAQPETLVSYDVIQRNTGFLEQYHGKTNFRFVQKNVIEPYFQIEPTDLLFTDTTHTYHCLSRELAAHAGQVRKFIAIHNHITTGEYGFHSTNPKYPDLDVMEPETVRVEGIGRAIKEFLDAHPEWRVKEEHQLCHGLMVLERVTCSSVAT